MGLHLQSLLHAMAVVICALHFVYRNDTDSIQKLSVDFLGTDKVVGLVATFLSEGPLVKGSAERSNA